VMTTRRGRVNALNMRIIIATDFTELYG